MESRDVSKYQNKINGNRELKHIRGLAKVLNQLAGEVEKRGRFMEGDLELLKKVGSDILFQAIAISYKE